MHPLQCSCLEDPGDGGVWWAAVCGVAQSWTRLKRLNSSSYSLPCARRSKHFMDGQSSQQIDGETMETVTDFIFLGSKISLNGDCSHEIKRHFLLGRKAMIKLLLLLLSHFSRVRLFESHGLYSPWNSPGQNTGVGSPSLLQGISPTQDQTQVFHFAGGLFTS